MSGTCIDCAYSHLGIQGLFQSAHLMCRSGPPTPLIMPGNGPGQFQLTALYPIVDKNATCGLFKAGPAGRLAKEDASANDVRIVS